MTPDDATADRLDRYWDGLARHRPVHPGGLGANGPDPVLARAVQNLHAMDDAPAPDAGFAARLRAELGLAAGAPALASDARADGERVGRMRLLAGGGIPVAQLAAAAAIALAILSGQLLGFGGTDAPTATAAPGLEAATAAAGGCLAAPVLAAADPPGTAAATGTNPIQRSSTIAVSCRPAP